MNEFSNLFSQRIKNIWSDTSGLGQSELLKDILNYANADAQKFKSELKDIQFNKDVDPLPVVLEALAKDTNNWGAFFVEKLDEILNAAQNAKKPYDILIYLLEFDYIAKCQQPFVQQIVERLHKAVESGDSTVSRAAIFNISSFMNNGSITNKNFFIYSLQEKLNDKSWKTRLVAYEALKFENLLPKSYILKFTDRALLMIMGKPYDFI